MPSFPTATRISFYEIDGYFYQRVLQSVAVKNPSAIRAVVGETGSIAWFVPTGISSSPNPADAPQLPNKL